MTFYIHCFLIKYHHWSLYSVFPIYDSEIKVNVNNTASFHYVSTLLRMDELETSYWLRCVKYMYQGNNVNGTIYQSPLMPDSLSVQ